MIELTADEYLDEWKRLLGDITDDYEDFEECIRAMEKRGAKFYLNDGTPIIDTRDYMNEIDHLEGLFKL